MLDTMLAFNEGLTAQPGMLSRTKTLKISRNLPSRWGGAKKNIPIEVTSWCQVFH